MKNKIAIVVAIVFVNFAFAQEKLITRTAKVTFESNTSVESFTAKNTQVASILITGTKTIAFNVLLKSFRFEKALMEEHFNEKYVHSDRYPAAKYKGVIQEDIDLKKPGRYNDLTLNGTMNFHGVSRPIKAVAQIIVNEDQSINLTSNFKLNLEAFKIEIPSLVKNKISEDIVLSVDTHYKTSK